MYVDVTVLAEQVAEERLESAITSTDTDLIEKALYDFDKESKAGDSHPLVLRGGRALKASEHRQGEWARK